MAKDPKSNGTKADAPAAPERPKPSSRPTAASQVTFNTSELKSSYCNVCNGSSTREEVVVNFGVNDNWDMGKESIEVALQHRIVMSPHAAKRVRDMMIKLIDEHESRYGSLDK